MDAARWREQSHVTPAAHIRGTSRGIRPVSHGLSSLTLIVVHGIGGSKESFGPFFDELASCGAPLGSIWMADAFHDGVSYKLNEDSLGDETDRLDYSRDVFQMINYFQDEIQQPLVGIGDSLEAGVVGYLVAWHPRLFNETIILESALGPGKGNLATQRYYPGLVAIQRRDFWPTREEAVRELRKTEFYNHCNPRAFDIAVRYELRGVEPSDSTDGPSEASVALVTPEAVVMSMWVVPDLPFPGFKRRNDLDYPAEHTTTMARIRRPEAYRMKEAPTKLFCPVLYVWGTISILNGKKRKRNLLKGHSL